MIAFLTSVVILAALAFAWWLSGKIINKSEIPVTKITHVEHEMGDTWDGFWAKSRAPLPFDHEKELHAPYGGRRI